MSGIIDLGTAGGASGVAFAAIDIAVSRAASAHRYPSGNEIADQACEFLRHLIGERHHASGYLPQDAALGWLRAHLLSPG